MFEKNPFSIFDFLGYVFPGLVAMYFSLLFYNYDFSKSLFINSIQLYQNYNITTLGFLIISSYVIGHIIAYLSSITVEKFSVWCYGYPSDFLITDPIKCRYLYAFSVEHCHTRAEKWREGGKVWYKYLWRLIVTIAILPLAVMTLIANITGLKYFYIKKLDDYLITQFEIKWSKLVKYLGLSKPDEDCSDFHRITYHYTFERFPQHAKKLDNYVALYDFLRAMCFIMIIVSEFLIYFYIQKGYAILLYYCLVSFVIEYILFMAFMKFYRRFSLENIMCIITSVDIKGIKLEEGDRLYFYTSTDDITKDQI